ncbi:MAG: hypothetical protein LBV34_17100, partial [Nocardiopsaceae bacterium]|nr:hypothetical protein [Nocardiopsaceae bacterium]
MLTRTPETTGHPHRDLFVRNRSRITSASCAAIERIEQNWIVPYVAAIADRTAPVPAHHDWLRLLGGRLAEEREGSPAGRYLAEQATR